MKRTLPCMLGLSLLVALCASAQERPSALPTSATIVKLITFANQTGAIPQTTIFTPTADGFFRANIFSEVVVTNPANTGADFFCPILSFTSDTGATQDSLIPLCMPVQATLTNSSAALTYFFRAKANTPIAFFTNAYGGTPPVAPFAYTVYMVLERF